MSSNVCLSKGLTDLFNMVESFPVDFGISEPTDKGRGWGNLSHLIGNASREFAIPCNLFCRQQILLLSVQ